MDEAKGIMNFPDILHKMKVECSGYKLYKIIYYSLWNIYQLTINQMTKMLTIQNSMLRNILGIKLTDKAHLEDIFMKTKDRNIGAEGPQTSEIPMCGPCSQRLET